MAQEIHFDARQVDLGDILVRMGIITSEQLEKGLQSAGPDRRNLGKVLVDLGFTSEEKVMKAVSMRLNIPYFASLEGMIEVDAVRTVPESLARKCLAVPIFKTEESLTVGMSNPLDIHAIDELARYTGLIIRPIMTTLSSLFESIQRAYGREAEDGYPSEEKVSEDKASDAAVRSPSDRPAPTQEGLVLPPLDPQIEIPATGKRTEARKKTEPAKKRPPSRIHEEQSAVQLADSIFQEGLAKRASDIHIEPAEKMVRVRYRVDGILQDGKTVEKEMEVALVARIKILSKLDITETRLPQDGHVSYDYAGRKVDIRVSVLPTVYGEKIVMRILDSSKNIKKLAELGLAEANFKSFTAAIRRPNGIILVTGPTGSGKTTTLYAAVAELNDSSRNIVTLEDPVEYRIDRLNQVETLAKIGLTFAAGLRSILRQDPNIILVGEIRDLETAEIAIQAAVTGHLVFSTLHTNDSVATIHRLINMRVEPFLLSAALGGVMAQRLVRRLCDGCKKEHKLTRAEIDALSLDLKVGAVFFEPVGCESCLQTGYAGRIPVHEWLNMSRTLRELVLKRASIDELRAAAKSEGMLSLQDDALEKAGRGLTSLAEVVRVTREEVEG